MLSIKKIILSSLIIIFATQNNITFAGGGGGGASGFASEVTQILNNIELLGVHSELIPIEISDALTALSTNADMIKNTILDPIANGLISAALQTATENILAWVNGGASGNSLIIDCPECFIKDEGLKEVRNALVAIPEDSAFGGGMFERIRDSYEDKSLEAAIAELSKSPIPALMRNKICNDQTLTSLAIDRIADSKGEYSLTDLTAEKADLSSYACEGDPNSSDQQAKLLDLYAQRPDLGGTDALYEMTQGGNGYYKAEAFKDLVVKKVDTRERLIERDLYDGQNAVSEKVCTETKTDSAGGSYCSKESVVTPADAVQDALSFSLTAGVERLTNIMGDGTLTSMLTGFATDALVKGLSKGFTSSGGGNNTGTTKVVSLPVRKDLASDPVKKAALVETVGDELNYYETSLKGLEDVGKEYIAEINSYKVRIDAVKGCFDSLASRGISTPSSPSTAAAGYAYYNERTSRLEDKRTEINKHFANIVTARALIAETRTKLSLSESSQEIQDIYQNYRDTITSKNLPSLLLKGSLESDYMKQKNDARRDTSPEAQVSSCRQIETDYNNNLYYINSQSYQGF